MSTDETDSADKKAAEIVELWVTEGDDAYCLSREQLAISIADAIREAARGVHRVRSAYHRFARYDRVRVNAEGLQQFPKMGEMVGSVISFSKQANQVVVEWDERVGGQEWSEDFLVLDQSP